MRDKRDSSAEKKEGKVGAVQRVGRRDGLLSAPWAGAVSPTQRQAVNAASQTGGEFVCKTAALVLTKRGTFRICLLASSSVSVRILLVTLDSGSLPSLL